MLGVSPFPADSLVGVRERYIVPSVLAPFADDMARRMSRLSQGPLLEVLADTGVLTQAISSSISAGTAVVATDPDPRMLQHARTKPGLSRVTWQRADPNHLQYADASFGIVACLFGIAETDNPRQIYREARRMLKYAGRLVFAMPGPLRQSPVADCIQDTLEAMFPSDPPQFLRARLHAHANHESIDDDLTEAGFTDAMYTTVDLPYHAASAHDAATGYCLGTALRHEIDARAPDNPENVVRAVAESVARQFGDGPIQTRMRGYYISAAG